MTQPPSGTVLVWNGIMARAGRDIVVTKEVQPMDVVTLTKLLRETEEHHGSYEATAPKHDWSRWYAAYIVAREQGRTTEEAANEAALHVESGGE